ncbi:hypothetical protein GCM10022416_26870 [Actinomadura keratinilytica]|uniref:Uncharacterized protein n=1 Tax=Actinomadura keratinilytica TaxID=547461 RepID=A0ABP7YRX6_9ACTN
MIAGSVLFGSGTGVRSQTHWWTWMRQILPHPMVPCRAACSVHGAPLGFGGTSVIDRLCDCVWRSVVPWGTVAPVPNLSSEPVRICGQAKDRNLAEALRRG